MARRGWLYGLFFFSGVSSLIYELVWQRLLNLVFGVSTLSASAVLAAFMTGLALGGLLLGRLADRTSRPLRLYAWIEVGIGAASFLVPPGFVLLTAAYALLYACLEPGLWGGACLRFGMSLVVLIVPATLIGATLPVMGRLALNRNTPLPATISLLYGVNTLGAVCGAVLTGFALLHFLGMQQSLWLAAVLNFLVAAVAGLASRKEVRSPWSPVGSKAPSSDYGLRTTDYGPRMIPALALGCAGVSGGISMSLEVLWARILGILTSNSAYGFALLLTVLLLGLGAGSLLQHFLSWFRTDPWRRLALSQWLLAGLTLATVPFFRTTPVWLEQWCDGSSVRAVLLGELVLTSAALFLPALLMGLSLPLLIAGTTGDAGRLGYWLGRIYAVNTIGCALGAFLTGFFIIPWLGIPSAVGLIVAGTLFVGMVGWWHAVWPAPVWRWIVGACLTLAAGATWAFVPIGSFLKSPVEEPRRLLFYGEGNNATVAVIEEADNTRSILVDGQPVAGTVASSVVDQKMLAHLPLLLHPAPQRALTVGFGSGGTSYSMTLHGIDVDCVEIEESVPAGAGLFRSENHDVLRHPRFRLMVDDARSWLRVAAVRYDVIATDCTNIQYRSNGDLYTVDYFHLMKDRLTSDGLAAAWVPANGIAERDLKTLLRSFRQVFPHTSVWYMNSLATDFLIVVGTPHVLDIDWQRLFDRMRTPEIAKDLQTVGLGDPYRLMYTFLAGEDDLVAYLGSGPLNTDDRPVLSFTTYGATFRRTVAGNLLRLLACRGDVARFVKNPPPSETMLRHYAASNETLLGHISFLAGAPDIARTHYARSTQLLSSDSEVQE
jgi:spermidine synthase